MMTNPEIIELHCDDCNSTYYATEDNLNQYDIEHCLQCGGVNVNPYYMRFQEYLDYEHPEVEVVDEWEDRRERIWQIVKGINTDDELDEIWNLLYDE